MGQITIKDIAKICGVAVSTVSRAINNHPDINEETKNLIMETIKEYNYIPNNSARNLKRTDSKTIAVLVKDISNPFWGRILEVMGNETAKEKYSLVLQNVGEDENEVEIAIQLEKEKRLKGIIFLGGMYEFDEKQLQQLTVPYVISASSKRLPENSEHCAVVTADTEYESFTMIDYLCKLGHKKIVILTSDSNGHGKYHLRGYEKALRKNNIDYDSELVIPMKKDIQSYTIKNGYEVTKELLNSKKEFTAIYAISDMLAIGACRAIFDMGKNVPDDYMVAGSDGLDMALYYHPSITTKKCPREKIAKKTIQVLFELIEKKNVEKMNVFSSELILGESTALSK